MISNMLSKIQIALCLCLFLTLSLAEKADASTGRLARAEFIYLQYMADFQDYQAEGTYVLVEGSNFIALQRAYNEKRTCLFGFEQSDSEGSHLLMAETQFVCFNTNRYNLILYKQYCEVGTQGCEIDPAAISIGIGNLNIFIADPTLLGSDPKVNIIPSRFPTDLVVKLNGEEATSEWKPRPLPGRYNGSPLILGR